MAELLVSGGLIAALYRNLLPRVKIYDAQVQWEQPEAWAGRPCSPSEA